MRSESSSGGSLPCPEIKATLRPLATAVQAELRALGHDIAVSQALELVAASFGFYKFQTMLRSRPQLHMPRRESSEFSQFRPESIEARAATLLSVDGLRAMRLSALVTHIMRESGLAINALEAFLRSDDSTRTVLSALGSNHEKYEVVNATVAMHVGLIPLHPADTPLTVPQPDHLGRLGVWTGIVQALEAGEFHLWRWPASKSPSDALGAAFLDVYRPSPLGIGPDYKFGGSAELGLGFSLISEQHRVARFGGRVEGFSIWTPVHHYRRASGWHTQWLSGGSIFDPSMPERLRGHRPEVEVGKLPIVRVCSECGQIFAEGEAGALAHRAHH